MYSIVLMAAVGTGPAAPAADVAAPGMVLPANPVVLVGCAGCTGAYSGCSGYAVSAGCSGSCHGCYGSGCHGGLFGHKARARGGMFGHHNKSSCNGCGGGYSCTGYSCFGSYAGCSGCYGSCYGHGYGFGYSCFGSYAGCTGSGYGCHGSGYGYGCGGAVYPAYSYPYAAPAYVVPVETPAKPADPDAGKADPKADPKKDGTSGAANLKFRLPAGATLYVDGRATPGDGAERAFFTPALEPGQKYFYDVRAEYAVGGQTLTEDRRVVVAAGAEYVVEFPKLLAAAGTGTTLAGK